MARPGRNVRIHLDRVTGLGDFVELEAVTSTADGLDAELPRIEALRAALGIADDALVPDGYANLAERAQRVMLRGPSGPASSSRVSS